MATPGLPPVHNEGRNAEGQAPGLPPVHNEGRNAEGQAWQQMLSISSEEAELLHRREPRLWRTWSAGTVVINNSSVLVTLHVHPEIKKEKSTHMRQPTLPVGVVNAVEMTTHKYP